jgi:hypothetical protein
MANVMNMHTIPIRGVDLIGAGVVLLHRELVEVVCEMVGGAGIHIPPGINIVSSGLATMAMCCSSSDLTVHVATIIIDAKVLGFEPLEAP